MAPLKALSAISDRLKQGASVSEVNDAFRAHEFPALESIESQLSLLKAVEQAGQSAVVHQVGWFEFISLIFSLLKVFSRFWRRNAPLTRPISRASVSRRS